MQRQYPWPSIIRLSRFVSVPYKKVVLTRKNIMRRDGYKCAYCGRGDLTLTIDHINPKARGGDDSCENLVSACTHCNNKKGDRTPVEAGMMLMVRPFKPVTLCSSKMLLDVLMKNGNLISIFPDGCG